MVFVVAFGFLLLIDPIKIASYNFIPIKLDLMWLTDGNDADASSEGSEVEPKLRRRCSNNPPPSIRLNNNEHAISVPE